MTEQIACPTLRPTLRMLSDEQIRTIHNTSLDILSGTGIEMRHEGARTLLLDAGAWQSGDRIKIPEHLIMQALHTAPSRIPMHNRLGQLTMPLEEGKVYFGTGSDCQFTFDAGNPRTAPLGRRGCPALRPTLRRARPDRLRHVDGHARATCRPWITTCTASSR